MLAAGVIYNTLIVRERESVDHRSVQAVGAAAGGAHPEC